MNPRAKSVEVLENHQLNVEFANGEKGVFSMVPYLEFPVYAPLKDYRLFSQAHVSMGFISWNDEIDISPDNLYLETKL